MSEEQPKRYRVCRKCGCWDQDTSGCMEKTGLPCYWVEADLCSACHANATGILPEEDE